MEILDSGHERRRWRGDDQRASGDDQRASGDDPPALDGSRASDGSDDPAEYLDAHGHQPGPPAARGHGTRRLRLAAALTAAAVLGGVVVGTVVDRRADEQRNRAQAERAAERAAEQVQLRTIGFPGDGSFDDDAPPAGRPEGAALLDYRVVVLNSGRSDIELVDVVVPPQGGVAANQPGRLRDRLIPAQGQADVNLRLRFDCANRPTAGPVLRIVARPPGGREVTTEQRVAELHESISEAAEFRCGGPSDPPPDVAFVSARPRGDRELVLSLHATGAPDTRLSAVAVKYPGLVTKPGTALPIALRGEAPTRVLVTARVADCRAALAATDPPELHASYGSDDDGDGDTDLVSSAGMEPVFVTAIVRFLYATCR